MKKLFSGLAILFFTTCNNGDKSNGKVPVLYPKPHRVKFTINGYATNQFTGDSLDALINSMGDTIRTGVPVATAPTMIPDTFAKPKGVPVAAKLPVVDAHPNVFPVSKKEGTVVAVENLKKIKLGKGDSKFKIINAMGDTIPSGIPIAVRGRTAIAKHPPRSSAFDPRFRDNVTGSFQYLDVDQGLISSNIFAVLEDSKGNIWIGSGASGVTRYDGRTFTSFSQENGLPAAGIWCMCEDSKGNIWFGTYGGGVCCYDGNTFTQFTLKNGLPNNIVWSLLEDKKGNMWFGTNGGGACKYDGKTFTHYTTKEGLAGNGVWTMYEDRKGNIWFGTHSAGFCKFDGTEFTHYNEQAGLTNPSVFSILEDKKGRLWVATYGGGVYVYEGNEVINYTSQDGLAGNGIMDMVEDDDGNIWFGSAKNGVCKFDGSSFVRYSEGDGITDTYVRCLTKDNAGNIWIGTNAGGITIAWKNGCSYYSEKNGLFKSQIRSITEDNKGNLWFGTNGMGFNKYDGKFITGISKDQGLTQGTIRGALQDKDGNMWFSTQGAGVIKYDGKTITHLSKKEGLSDDSYKAIYQDKKGNLWFASSGSGANFFDGKNWWVYDDKNGMTKSVNTIFEDRDGNLWFGSGSSGAIKFDGRSFIHYTENDGMSNNLVTDILQDDAGNMWFATFGGGVNMFNGKEFYYFTEKEGMSSNITASLAQDKKGIIWVATEKGLTAIVKNKDAAYSLHSFDKKNGIACTDYYQESRFLDAKNRMWWGGARNLLCQDMNQFKISDAIIQPYFRQVDVNERFVDYRNLSDSLKKIIEFDSVVAFENYPMGLRVPFSHNHLTFHFSAADWDAHAKVRYSYRIPSVSTEWSAPSEDTKAEFRNLPYGSHVFELVSVSESQQWSKPVSLQFTVHPPWYHTWLARTTYVIALLLAIYLFVRWRTARLKERQKQLEKKVDEATSEIRDQKAIIEEKHKEITDSINYAERIQRSFLATKTVLDENLRDHFIFFQPKDIVSGDFYWAGLLNNGKFAYVTADSTGHGVPGAIMSLLNITAIEKAVEHHSEPADILNATREIIIDRLKKDGSKEGGKDGMDCSLIALDQKNNVLSFAAANNPIWIVRGEEVLEFHPDKMPVGKHDHDNTPFTQHQVDLKKGDVVYAFTDGMADQFGGPKGKKFMYRKLKELFLQIAGMPMAKQKEQIAQTLNNWKGHLEQVDDICVVGVRI